MTEKQAAWIKGCTICPEGMCNEIDTLTEEQKMSAREAVNVVAHKANKSVGQDGFFSPNGIRMKYRRFKGILDDTKKEPGSKRPTPKTDPPVQQPIDMNDTAAQLTTRGILFQTDLVALQAEAKKVTESKVSGDLQMLLVELAKTCKTTIGALNR